MRTLLRASLILVLIGAVVGALLFYSVVRRGLSTRTQPSRLEEFVARGMRRLATPAAMRSMKNPLQANQEVFKDGLAHFADHCAVCHANDGSGATQIGRGLYPRAPDMRALPTQQLSDGELFSIIENGIRLTGMPAWGTGSPESERASWALVHFIRRLPDLTEDEIGRMEALNPKTAQQWREEEETRRFLEGDDVTPSTVSPHEHEGSTTKPPTIGH